jgi:prophage antirepressor-like protein
MQKTRIFSLRGAHLLAMFARTKVAKEFRRWVLDILDALHRGGEYVMQQYRQARAELEQGREIASECGKGLCRWKQIKQPLQARLEYWNERRQLALSLEVA